VGVLGRDLSRGLIGSFIGVGASMIMVGVGLALFGVEGVSFTGTGGTLPDVIEVVCDAFLLLERPEK
jgi:hypothetical protein